MNNQGKHLLIVDDEQSICEILGQFLKKKGFSISTAQSGEQAVEILKGTPADLVVTDIKMPGMSGVDLLKWMKESKNEAPVLITTGFPTLDTAIDALKLGAFDYLTKPFHLEEINEKIKRALENRHLQEENIVFSKLVSLHEVTKQLASTLDISDLNRKFLDFSVVLAGADGGSLMYIEPPSTLKIAEISGADYDRTFWMDRSFVTASYWVAAKEEPLLMDSNALKVPPGLHPIPQGLNSYIAFPLKTPSKTLGVLNLVRAGDKETFSSVDLEIINVLASQASISIDNVKINQEIRDNYLKTVMAFALAVEAKDEYTHGHSEQVMKYTVDLARRLGLPDSEIELIKYAGLLHDIGKIGISELILNKNGRLTPEEMEEIKKHPELGAKIISDVPFLKSLVPLVKHHHEDFDGGGYPQGIAGTEIPIGARIVRVTDSYEAMTSNRPYRKSLPPDVAFGILLKEKGRQFDPQIVDAFLDIMKKTG